MSGRKRFIFTGFEPNIHAEDTRLACRALLQPWGWGNLAVGDAPKQVEDWLKQYFAVPEAVTTDSGRSALFFALKAMGIGPGDEVLVQGYTCVVVVNAILAAGATPIYVDTINDFFMDPADAEKKVTGKTKAMIIQHTFGIPAELEALLLIAKQHHIRTVEDCAHTIGGEWQGEKLGTFADAAILSFGSDKVASCVRGGAVITSDAALGKRVRALVRQLPKTPSKIILKELLRYPIFAFGKRFYHLWVGKWILGIARRLRLVSLIIDPEEKRGEENKPYPTKFPNILAKMLLLQLRHLEASNRHRQDVAQLYDRQIKNIHIRLPKEQRGDAMYSYLRYPIMVEEPKKLRAFAKEQGILLGDWYDQVVAPCDAACVHIQYIGGSCPRAEHSSRGSVNLPTDDSIHLSDAERVVACINAFSK